MGHLQRRLVVWKGFQGITGGWAVGTAQGPNNNNPPSVPPAR